MAVYKCKSCNANLNIEPGDSLITCEFCGATQVVENTYPGENYVKRGYMFLEEGEFEQAKEYFDKALNESAEAYDAYLGKSLAGNGIKTKQDFFDLNKIEDLDSFIGNLKYSLEYKNAIRFAPSEEKEKLEKYRNSAYKRAYDMALSHKYKGEYEEAMALLKRIYDYKDAESIYKECQMLMDGASIEKKYRTAVEYMDKSAFKNAINLLDDLGDYKDSVTLIKECEYRSGKAFMKTEDYMDAIACFEKILGYENSKTLLNRCKEVVAERKYNYAIEMLYNSKDENSVKQAKNIFSELGNYKDSVDRVFDCDKEVIYIEANKHMKRYWDFNEIVIGQKMFNTIKKYKDSGKLAKKCNLYKIIIVMVLSLSVMGIGALAAYFVL